LLLFTPEWGNLYFTNNPIQMSVKQVNELKENKPELTASEVLPNKELQNKRYNKLVCAMQLWKVVHEKSKIIFKAGGEIRSVITPVWFVSEKYVCINAGVTILVSCILDVIL
jgi:hypothetical protein